MDYHESGYSFMVRKMRITFRSPAKLGDVLVVRTWGREITSRFRVVAKQIMARKGEPRDYWVTASVAFVAVGAEGQLLEVSAKFHSL